MRLKGTPQPSVTSENCSNNMYSTIVSPTKNHLQGYFMNNQRGSLFPSEGSSISFGSSRSKSFSLNTRFSEDAEFLSDSGDFSTLLNESNFGSVEKMAQGLDSSKMFLEKAILIAGKGSQRIPTHRELLQAGLPTSVQVSARRFLVSVGALVVNVRTKLADPFISLGDVKTFVDSWKLSQE